MRTFTKTRRLVAIALLALLTSACAQQAAFVSSPPGAKVFIDNQQIGVTPCNYDYKLGHNGKHAVRIAKEGYDAVDFTVVTDEVDSKARNRWMAAGVVWSPLWLGTLFTKKLKDSYDFALRAEPPQVTAKVQQAGPTNGL